MSDFGLRRQQRRSLRKARATVAQRPDPSSVRRAVERIEANPLLMLVGDEAVHELRRYLDEHP